MRKNKDHANALSGMAHVRRQNEGPIMKYPIHRLAIVDSSAVGSKQGTKQGTIARRVVSVDPI